MRSILVEVHHIRSEHALELLLLQDEQMIEAFLPHTSKEPLTDGIGAFRVNRRFEYLDAAGGGQTREAGPKFVIVITNQIPWHLPIRSRFPERYAPPRHRLEILLRRHGSPVATSVRR